MAKLRILHVALLASVAVISCDKQETTPADPKPVQAPSPSSASQPDTVVLPATGNITTGTLTPSSTPTRIPSAAEQQQALDLVMNRLAQGQAAGLKNARITVNAAWNYKGYSYLSPDPAAAIPVRMVAIDLTVEGHTSEFDPDDIEIVDGITLVSYDSNPHLSVIQSPGVVIEDPNQIPKAPAPLRLMLIYAFPKNTPTFTLFYWGQKLLDKPHGFDAEGWGLPYPEKEETPPAP
ncbi:MAG: hypothetical protein KDL87_00630 [Verrucomicrobiae bacterium]|nr:hypothetical protein [Verrucomicrobiae bacterium]